MFVMILLQNRKHGGKSQELEIGIKATLKEGLMDMGNWSSGMILA